VVALAADPGDVVVRIPDHVETHQRRSDVPGELVQEPGTALDRPEQRARPLVADDPDASEAPLPLVRHVELVPALAPALPSHLLRIPQQELEDLIPVEAEV